jgi:molybdate transport system substrate-binding protein
MFISADLDWMDYLQQRNLIQPTTRKNLLGNKLVIVAPADAAPGAGKPHARICEGESRMAELLDHN